VLKLLQDGRLVALGDLTSGMSISCERCGKSTSAGRYCAHCVEQMGQALKSSADALSERPDAAARLRRPETLQEKRGHSGFRPER
jgi:ribosomal protein L32